MQSRYPVFCPSCQTKHPAGTEIEKRAGKWVPVSCSTQAPQPPTATPGNGRTNNRVGHCDKCFHTLQPGEGHLFWEFYEEAPGVEDYDRKVWKVTCLDEVACQARQDQARAEVQDAQRRRKVAWLRAIELTEQSEAAFKSRFAELISGLVCLGQDSATLPRDLVDDTGETLTLASYEAVRTEITSYAVEECEGFAIRKRLSGHHHSFRVYCQKASNRSVVVELIGNGSRLWTDPAFAEKCYETYAKTAIKGKSVAEVARKAFTFLVEYGDCAGSAFYVWLWERRREELLTALRAEPPQIPENDFRRYQICAVLQELIGEQPAAA
jgi:hypothetical protein